MARIDGQRLLRFREELGLSQAQLAKIAHMSEKTVVRAESTGIVHPSTVKLLATALEVPIQNLLMRSGSNMLAGVTSMVASPDPVMKRPGAESGLGRVIVSLDQSKTDSLSGSKLEDFFGSVLALLHAGFGVELRLEIPSEPEKNSDMPDP
jgi:DNA-binding XRE family transcriptional regulator